MKAASNTCHSVHAASTAEITFRNLLTVILPDLFSSDLITKPNFRKISGALDSIEDLNIKAFRTPGCCELKRTSDKRYSLAIRISFVTLSDSSNKACFIKQEISCAAAQWSKQNAIARHILSLEIDNSFLTSWSN